MKWSEKNWKLGKRTMLLLLPVSKQIILNGQPFRLIMQNTIFCWAPPILFEKEVRSPQLPERLLRRLDFIELNGKDVAEGGRKMRDMVYGLAEQSDLRVKTAGMLKRALKEIHELGGDYVSVLTRKK